MIKGGRPKLSRNKRKCKIVAVRFSDETYDWLEQASDAKGIKISEYIRSAVEDAIERDLFYDGDVDEY